MQTLLLNCLLVLVFVLVGGLFAASEIALVSLRPGQVAKLAEERGRRGRAVAHLVEDENNFLSSVQVGVTLAGFFSASFGAAQISPYLAPVIGRLGAGHALAATLAFILVTVLISYLSLVLGELVPKRLAMQSAQSVALALATPLSWISRGLRPVIWFLGASTDAVLRVLGRDPQARSEEMAPDELRGLVQESRQLGELERRIAGEVLGIRARRVSEIMTPRTEVVFLEAGMPVPDAARAIAREEFSRYPVTQGTTDDVVGYLHVRDLVDPPASAVTLRDLTRPLAIVPSSKPALEAMALLRERGEHIALVVDEYGGTDGVVTLEDIVEEFVGEITDEFDHAEPIPLTTTGSVRVSGLLGRGDVRRELGVELPPGGFDTLAGYLVAALGRVPRIGDATTLDHLQLTVTAMDGRRVDRIDVTRAVDGQAMARQA